MTTPKNGIKAVDAAVSEKSSVEPVNQLDEARLSAPEVAVSPRWTKKLND